MGKINNAAAKLAQRGGFQARKLAEQQAGRDLAADAAKAQTIEYADALAEIGAGGVGINGLSTPVQDLNIATRDVLPTQEVIGDQGSTVQGNEDYLIPQNVERANLSGVTVPEVSSETVNQIQGMGSVPTLDPTTGARTGSLYGEGVKEAAEDTMIETVSQRGVLESEEETIAFGEDVNRILVEDYYKEIINNDGDPQLDIGALLNNAGKSFQGTGDKLEIFGTKIDMNLVPDEAQSEPISDPHGFIKRYAGNFLGSIMANDKLNMLEDPNLPATDPNNKIRAEFGRVAMIATIMELGNRIELMQGETDKEDDRRRYDNLMDRSDIGKGVARRIERLLYPTGGDVATDLFKGETSDFGYEYRLDDNEQSILGQVIVQGFADSPFVDFYQSRLVLADGKPQKMTFVSTRQGDIQLPIIRKAINRALGKEGHDRPVSGVPLKQGKLLGEGTYTQNQMTTQVKKNSLDVKNRKGQSVIKEAIDSLSSVAHTTSDYKNNLMKGMLKNAQVNMGGWFAKVAKQDSDYLKRKEAELLAGFLTKEKTEGLKPQDLNPEYSPGLKGFKEAAAVEASQIRSNHLRMRQDQLADAQNRVFQPFYYGYTVINNSSRLMISQTELNYQADKVARFLVDGATPVVWNKGNKKKERAFNLVLARSLVPYADKMPKEQQLAKLEELRPSFIKFGNSLVKYTNDQKAMANLDPRRLAEAEANDQGLVISENMESYFKNIGKDGFYFAMDALHELARYEATPNGQSFATRLKAEMDGNANGAVIQGMQMGISRILKKGGVIFTDIDNITKSRAELLEEDIRYDVFKEMQVFDETSKDMRFKDILESIKSQNKVKDLMKNPIMTTIYGKESRFHSQHAKKFMMDNKEIFKNILNDFDGDAEAVSKLFGEYLHHALNKGLGGAIEHGRLMKTMGRAFNFTNRIVEVEGANGFMVQAGGFEYYVDQTLKIPMGQGLSPDVLSPNEQFGTARQSMDVTTYRRKASAQSKADAKVISEGTKNNPKIGSKLRNQLAVNGTQNIDATVAQKTVTRVQKQSPDGLVMQVYDAFMGDVNTYEQLLDASNDEFKIVNRDYNMIIAEKKALIKMLDSVKKEVAQKKAANETYDIGLSGDHSSLASFLMTYQTVINQEVPTAFKKRSSIAMRVLATKLTKADYDPRNPAAHIFVDPDLFLEIVETAMESLQIVQQLDKKIAESQKDKRAIQKQIRDITIRQYS